MEKYFGSILDSYYNLRVAKNIGEAGTWVRFAETKWFASEHAIYDLHDRLLRHVIVLHLCSFSKRKNQLSGLRSIKNIMFLHKERSCFWVSCSKIALYYIKCKNGNFQILEQKQDCVFSSASIITWNALAKLLLVKYFSEAQVSNLRREIRGIKQAKRKALHTYWEWFKELLVRSLQHKINDYHLYQCFYEGMTPMEWRLTNASSGGSLGYMTLTKIRELIEKLAIESKNFGNEEEWYPDHPWGIIKVNYPHLDAQNFELKKVSLLLKKEKGIVVLRKQCEICLKIEHPIDMCPYYKRMLLQ